MSDIQTVLVADIETTGLDFKKGAEVIEVSAAVVHLKSGDIIHHYTQRIKPDVMKMDAKSEAIHGISLSDLTTMPTFAEQAPMIDKLIKNTGVFMAHNLDFDWPFITYWLKQHGFRHYDGRRTFCTMKNGTWATADGKKPTLSELCFASGVDYDKSKAHAAQYDVERTVKCLNFGVQGGWFKLPE